MENRFKFRAWEKMEKKFILGCVMDCSQNNVRIWKQTMQGKGINFDFKTNNVILTQCLGIKDKNGKLIYEGDIIEAPNGNLAEIIWSDKTLSFKANVIKLFLDDGIYVYRKDLTLGSITEIGDTDTGVVIGNIYENPELLKLVRSEA